MTTPENKTETIDVLDAGFVRLDAINADDLSVVNSARVSFGQNRTEMFGFFIFSRKQRSKSFLNFAY